MPSANVKTYETLIFNGIKLANADKHREAIRVLKRALRIIEPYRSEHFLQSYIAKIYEKLFLVESKLEDK